MVQRSLSKKIPRRERPAIFLNVDSNIKTQLFVETVANKAKDYGWRLIDVAHTRGVVPEGVSPIGGLFSLLPSNAVTQELAKHGCPMVRLGKMPHPDDDRFPVVLPDFFAAGEMGAEHFIQRGYKYLGYVGQTPWRELRDLYHGFSSRAGGGSCECHLLQLVDRSGGQATTYQTFVDQLQVWLQDLPKPIGIMTYSDGAAARISDACYSIGISVPEEVALLGCGNALTSQWMSVPISSVDLDLKQQVERAMTILHSAIEGKPYAAVTTIPPLKVVTRTSTDLLAVENAAVAKAVRFIWEHLDWPITVADIAYEVSIPERTLARLFKNELGRTVHAELLRKRLERCRELLRETDLTIAQICKRTGFKSQTHLHRVFREKIGMTPDNYRRSH